MPIAKVAVLGSGVMGSGIAAHIANSGIPVVLLDIVPAGSENRNALTEKAIEKQLGGSPSGFTHKSRVKLVTCGNLEDNLDLLADVDWIIEAVLEKLEVKQDVYRKIDAVRKKGSVVSSNTSTLPLHVLLEGMGETFAQDFMITHFFNPPRFMHLLEMLAGPKTRKEAYAEVRKFADVKLGKGVVDCKDTPGFIANRIGVFWLMTALAEAIRLGINVEDADAVMGKPFGIPKTAVFGLFDLIGIDLMPLIAKAMLATLPENDLFRTMYHEPELVKKMIAEGYTGRKGKGGFYRINKEGGKKTKEVINLQTGDYAPERTSALESVASAKSGIGALLAHPDKGGEYARIVMAKTFAYTASLLPEIADNVLAIDNTMKWGYNWKSGPFEMMDKIGVDKVISLLESQEIPVPEALKQAQGKSFYTIQENKHSYLALEGGYVTPPHTPGIYTLADRKLGQKPVLKNASAALWDIGDGIACLELTSKMNSIDADVLKMLEEATAKVKTDFSGLVINGDADNFSVGANLSLILYAANIASWTMISDLIKQGQRAMMGLKYAPFPVVSGLSGMALGGGCEMVLHSAAVQAHMESYPGLVETGVGLIPGWGGCKEMLLRHAQGLPAGGVMPAIIKVFEIIATAKTAMSADDAKEMKILGQGSRISMNRDRLLADSKQLCAMMADNYLAPEPATLFLPGETAKASLMMAFSQMKDAGKTALHDEAICDHLATVLSGGATDITESVAEQQLLDLEHAAFMELVKTKPTLERIEHMLANGKPLRN